MGSLEASTVLLAGNHRAITHSGKGHNGRIEAFEVQAEALREACKAYRSAIEKGPVHLFTTIDHLGGKRVLTGRRGRPSLLQVSDLVNTVRGPLLKILNEQGVDPENLRVIPESTLKIHIAHMRTEGLLTEAATHAAFSAEQKPTCRGLASAYLHWSVQEALKLGPVVELNFFIEVDAKGPVKSLQTYANAVSLFRFGLLEDNWRRGVEIRGWDCTTKEAVLFCQGTK